MTDFGLVLSGGASRGAYQAGVLRFLLCDLAPRLGYVPWPSVVSGTSVGALNGSAVVTRDTDAIRRLSAIWQNMRLNDVFDQDQVGVFSTVRSLFAPREGTALLDPTPLRRLLREQIPWADIRRAIDSGRTRAFILSATELSTGTNVLFTDTADEDLYLDPLPGARVDRVSVGPEHLMSSAAIPLVFPAVRVGDELYVDGGLRQNTPLRPVLKAGCRRVLIVSPHVEPEFEARTDLGEVVPTLPFMAGKSMNALMADPVSRDVHLAEQINRIIRWGEETYGPSFRARFEAGLGMHEVEILKFEPSADLGRLASTIFNKSPPATTTQMGWLLSMMADQPNQKGGESDLLAYLLFDRSFTGPAEALGFEDARGREEQLANFLLRGRDVATQAGA
jgi:NTE family protein